MHDFMPLATTVYTSGGNYLAIYLTIIHHFTDGKFICTMQKLATYCTSVHIEMHAYDSSLNMYQH